MKKFEKIFFSMIAMIMIVAVGSVFTSCTNDDDLQGVTETSSISMDSECVYLDTINPVTRSTTSVQVLQTKYSPLYFYHQYNNGQTHSYCGQTSYMVATKTIAAYNSISYSMGYSTQNSIANNIRTIRSISSNVDAVSPYDLWCHWYTTWTGYRTYMTCNYARSSGGSITPNSSEVTRGGIKNFIETSLSQGRLVIAPVMIFGSNRSNAGNDTSISGTNANTEASSNYISKFGNVGHYIVIYRLDREYNSEGNSIGTIYYLDVYQTSSSNCLHTVNYLRFLDANLAAGSTYSAMWFDDPQ